MRLANVLRAGLALAVVGLTAPSVFAQGGPFVNFETIPTRALALTPDGSRLLVTNTPAGRLDIFSVRPDGLVLTGSVPVGLDPISVAVRSNSEAWVVNHLSDSVSVVDITAGSARVTRTLLVGDEPRDVVFAGPGNSRAFITAARRGQNHPDDTVNETQVPGIGRADVWVFDANDLGTSLGGDPLTIVTLFADKPGALAATPDGRQVFVSIFSSGNRTSVINDMAVCSGGMAGGGQNSAQNDGPCQLPNGGTSPGGVLAPNTNQVDNFPNPRTGIIVKFDPASGGWLDGAGRDWRDAVPFSLPDNDVFTINAMANPPVQSGVFQSVGTTIQNIAVHPTNGRAYVANVEAINTNRFLSVPALGAFPNPNGAGGAARTADPVTGRTLNGHLYESRITILGPNGSVTPRHLNKHIDYEVVPSPPGVKERSVANPQGVIFSPDGNTLFVAALGSRKIVPFSVAQLNNDSFVPNAANHIQLTGDAGPTDMVIDATGRRMFVYKRFDNAVATIDLATRREVSNNVLFNPEPAAVRVGRKFLYDATIGSSNGEANCNVCHPSADKDDLAWDLGTPFFGLADNPNPFVPAPGIFGAIFPDPVAFNDFAGSLFGGNPTIEFNPLKGPMTVLTLRGIKDSGPLFWRGDATNPTNPLDERANFQNFNIVFPALQGAPDMIPQSDFDAFTDWVLTLVPPPNPHRNLDNSLTASQQAGSTIFRGSIITDVIFTCQNCHGLDPSQGFFGTRGQDVVEGETQFFKVTQLRTTYDKVGMFGHTFGDNGDARTLGGPRVDVGPQVRGTGTLHDGSAAGPEEFLTAEVFQLTAPQLRQVVDFVFAFPSNLAPIVGQQATLGPNSGPDTIARINLMQQRAGAPFPLTNGTMTTEADLVAKARIGGLPAGFLYRPATNDFLSDRGETISVANLRAMAQTPGQEITFTAVYPGGGRRIGIDRDLDGTLDGNEANALQGLIQAILRALLGNRF